MDIENYIYTTKNGEKIYPTIVDNKIIQTGEEVWKGYIAERNKQIDICPPKTNQELQEEIENLKAQLETVHERLCTQQEMSSTVIAHVFGMEALKNE